jgi:hypothetical protein
MELGCKIVHAAPSSAAIRMASASGKPDASI